MDINVTKRDGSKEPLNLAKLHKVVEWACEGISGVSESEVELKSSLSFYNNIKTSDIQETLIKAAADLITEDTPNYQWVAGRLINYHLRKEVYGQYEPIDLYYMYNLGAVAGLYTDELYDYYTKEEFSELQNYIKHDRDFSLTYAAMEQMRQKYLVRSRATNKFFETPQIMYMLISMVLFADEPIEHRLDYVKEYYDLISTHVISLPTPIMAGVRTSEKQFSSCVLIETDDTIDSISATTTAIMKYVSMRAGIGIGAGRLRPIGSPVKGGAKTHTGVIPFYRVFESAIKSCSQGGVRNGSGTLNYPIWHYEVQDLLVLKNNKGTQDNRIRNLDYCVQFNRVMYERLLSGGNITLFSPHDFPEMYEAFYSDVDKFRELYEKAERMHKVRKLVVPAKDLFEIFMQERKETGRIYLMNVDNVNTQGPFIESEDPIRMTNLCCEITLPTTPSEDFNKFGEIALCTLSAINWGKIKSPEDFERPCYMAVRALNNLLMYQDYPFGASALAIIRRSLGVGIINFAYWLAKHDMTYQNITKEQLQVIHEWTEAWSYYLIKASCDMQKEFVEKNQTHSFFRTKYDGGIVPIDTYNKNVDELVDPIYKMDWDSLRENLKQYGIYNSTLMALMPAETSAQISNSTNGIEPVRSLITIKGSKHGQLVQVVPEIKKLKKKYDLLWDQKSPEGYLKIVAVLQKFVDQAISVNTSYNPKFYPGEQLSMTDLLKDILTFYKYGGKNLYYFNTMDGSGEISDISELVSGEIEEEDCDSCKI